MFVTVSLRVRVFHFVNTSVDQREIIQMVASKRWMLHDIKAHVLFRYLTLTSLQVCASVRACTYVNSNVRINYYYTAGNCQFFLSTLLLL